MSLNFSTLIAQALATPLSPGSLFLTFDPHFSLYRLPFFLNPSQPGLNCEQFAAPSTSAA